MSTGQTPSADEDHVIQSKAPEQLLNGACSYFIVLKFHRSQQQSLASKEAGYLIQRRRRDTWPAVNRSPAGSDRPWRRWRRSQRRRRCGTPQTWGWAVRRCGPSSWWCGPVAGTCAWSWGWSAEDKQSQNQWRSTRQVNVQVQKSDCQGQPTDSYDIQYNQRKNTSGSDGDSSG